MSCHWTKNVLIWPFLSFETKKFPGGWWWWVKSNFSVSLCPSLIFRHTDTKWTQSLTILNHNSFFLITKGPYFMNLSLEVAIIVKVNFNLG